MLLSSPETTSVQLLDLRKNTVKRLKNDVDIVIHYRSIQYVIRPPAPSLHDLNKHVLASLSYLTHFLN